ncbi:hypothetical protein ACR782_07335 [Sphingobacterium spiritivorum]|uniref:hypothetical protein n=1 Tax=Sphingobacterium spiritivorum TaxID=258 RepID=UPI003DA3D2C8
MLNSRSASAIVSKNKCASHKKFTLIFAAQIHRSSKPFNFFGHRSGNRNFILWCSLAYKKCQCACRLFLAFFYAGAHGINYMFFCLDAKEPKNQGCDGFTKNELREAKMQKLASLKQFTFFNASLHTFS